MFLTLRRMLVTCWLFLLVALSSMPSGRHPLAGIAAAFAGVSGGFSANFIPSGIDPLLAGFTQTSAQVLDAGYIVNPLANYILYWTIVNYHRADWLVCDQRKL